MISECFRSLFEFRVGNTVSFGSCQLISTRLSHQELGNDKRDGLKKVWAPHTGETSVLYKLKCVTLQHLKVYDKTSNTKECVTSMSFTKKCVTSVSFTKECVTNEEICIIDEHKRVCDTLVTHTFVCDILCHTHFCVWHFGTHTFVNGILSRTLRCWNVTHSCL